MAKGKGKGGGTHTMPDGKKMGGMTHPKGGKKSKGCK